MVQNRPVALDGWLPLPAVGLKDFVEGFALHTSREGVTATRGGVEGFRGGLYPSHLPSDCQVGLNHALTFLVGG